MTGGEVLLTGAGGFVGGAVARAFAQAPAQAPAALRLMAHRRPVPGGGAAALVRGDLTDPASLRGCCEGVRVVVHAASEVGSDEARCTAVNLHGTANLLAEASRAGVRDFVYVSTAAVHGLGPHRGLPEDSVPAPVSAASRSRYAAEQRVRAAGGIVLRPFLTYGEGARWFIPALLRRLTRHPVLWLGTGGARQSVICVDDLAGVVVAAAARPDRFAGGRPFHVAEPEPVVTGELVAALARLYGLGLPPFTVPGAPLRAVLRGTPGLARRRRQAELFGVDHVYRGDRVWDAAGRGPCAALPRDLPRFASWYRRFLPADPMSSPSERRP